MDLTQIEKLAEKIMQRIENDRCIHKSSLVDEISAFQVVAPKENPIVWGNEEDRRLRHEFEKFLKRGK